MKTLSTRKQPSIRWLRFLAGTMLAGSVALAFGMIGCGGGGGGGGAGTTGSAVIKSGISDPAQECLAPNGPYQAVYVTVTDVKAHLGSSAGPNSSGWQDLTPNAPATQVNLLGSTTTDCLLATLGTTSGLPAGKYQQIRIFMAPNGSSFSGEPASNACNNPGNLAPNVWNCVETGGHWYPLTMPSNANSGLKIPPGQIAKGGLTVQDGKGLDLDVDVNACASVVAAGKSGKYLFKPTLRAGEIGTSPLVAGNLYEASVLNGTVTIPASSPSPVPGAMVWLEQQSTPVTVGNATATTTTPVDNLIETTSSDSNGHFEFCPVPVSSVTYDIVANTNAMPSTNNLSDTTITTGVNVTNSGGPNNLVIPLVAAAGNATSISGNFTTVNTTAVTGDNVQYSPTQPFTGNSGTVQALEPAAMATPSADTQPPTAQTASISTCTTAPCNNTVAYQLGVANSNPIVGAASSTGSGYAAPTGNATYSVWGSANSIPSSTTPSTPVCSPSSLITNPVSSFPASGAGVSLTFQSCD